MVRVKFQFNPWAVSLLLLVGLSTVRGQESPAMGTVDAPATTPAPVPESAGPQVLVPTTQTAPVVNTVAPLPELRSEPTTTAVVEPVAPVKPQLKANGELPDNFDAIPHEDQMRLLVDQRVQAAGILLKDARTGEVLFARDEDGQYPPASTTKLLTALLCYELTGLEGVIDVTEEDTKVEPSHVPLKAGERVSSRDLIYTLLIGSDNDAAMALGRHAAGSMPKFTDMMNRYALALGCTHSTFKNPNGLPAEGQLTTASDLMKIFERVLERPDLKSICVVQQFPLTTQTGTQIVKNHNKLLGRYIGMGPAKTGWTRASQHTYAASATRGDRTFHLTLLKSPNKWFDARLLFDYAFSVRPANARLLAEGVPPIPLIVQQRNLVTMPGGEVGKGQLPPEGLVVIKDNLPGSQGKLTKVRVTPPAPEDTDLKKAEGDEDLSSSRFRPTSVEPGSRPGVLQSADGTSYLATALDEEPATGSTKAPAGYRFRDYQVRNGDTLAIIASRYGCTVEMIEKYNRIPNRHRIAPGQKLTVPQRIQ
jgi:D-alanyl-D-alanine carboxypeptidase (penicillin-binding protein 5/6)